MVIEKCFFTTNSEFLERYTAIWKKISNLVNKKFDSDPIYNNKYINTKIRSYNNDIKTNVCNVDNKKIINYQKKTNRISAYH